MAKKKGLELPINMIIVIAIAVLVLVIVAAYFTGNVGQNTQTIAAQSAWNNYCGQLRVTTGGGNNCISSYVGSNLLNVNGNSETLDQICATAFGSTVATSCASKCCGTPS